MSTTKHTPGPWGVKELPRMRPEQNFFVFELQQGEGDPAEYCTTKGIAESIANAKLIAAAPELLASLKKVLEIAEGLYMSSRKPEYLHRPNEFEDAMKLINRVEPGFFL